MNTANVLSVSFDKAKLRAAATALKGEDDVLSLFESDPKAFLERFGVTVDGATSEAIRKRIANRNQAKPAGIVHIDI